MRDQIKSEAIKLRRQQLKAQRQAEVRRVANGDEILEDSYSEAQIAGFLSISVETLRNRHYAGKNHPPRTPERRYPKKEFDAWNAERLKYEHRDEKKRRRA